MTFTLLLDLDDTLIDTNLDGFLPGYFKKLAGYMADRVPPDQFVKALMHGTQVMYDSIRVDRTLEQVFGDHFYPALGFDQAALAGAIDHFYDDVFPTLAPLTKQRPEAIRFVEWAFAQGWNVCIATDPLFPRKAILHRLRWADLAPEKYPFTLISDFHNFHFAKKAVSYYPEFLGKMSWQDEPVLMVGDSLDRDIQPSQQAGVPVFWLTNDKTGATDNLPSGTFEDLQHFLEKTDLSTLKVNYKSPSALVHFLHATPALLHNLLLTNDAAHWIRQPATEEWSLLEVLCHLRDVDNGVNLPRLDAILKEDNAFIAGLDTDGWAKERNYAAQDTLQAFADFVTARTKLCEALMGLTTQDWERRARHSYLGPTTLRELVEFMVDHDRLHIRQATDALK